MITDRQKDILWAVIEAYAKKAEPISSKALAQKRGFNIGAPMIRKEMNQLEQGGFLVSPYTSAGRVPTDQAYRLYIQDQLNKSGVSGQDVKAVKTGLTRQETEKVSETLKKDWPDEQSLLKEISRLTSEISKELSITGCIGGADSYIFGFSNLVDEPEFSSFDGLNRLMRFMDNADHCFDILWNKFLYQDLQVFIGSENPIKEINEFTLITGKYQLPDGDDGFISIIGPKRMNYRRNMALVEYISGCLNEK
ncbi:MAG: hypothetical protein HY452_00560 [Parcubacteria group bacterium]|nr:hypothetical protein [Parcubacteria group bacterium]